MSEWDEYAEGWDDTPGVHEFADGVVASLTALAGKVGVDLEGSTVCDFGCGTGLLTERLAGLCTRIDAIDTSPAMLTELRTKVERHGWSHVRLLDHLPEEPQGYDVVACSSVLAFVDDYPAVARTLASHLRPGGLFVQWDWELDPSDDEPHGLTRDDVRGALEAAGLADVSVGIGFEIPAGEHTMRPLMGSGRAPG